MNKIDEAKLDLVAVATEIQNIGSNIGCMREGAEFLRSKGWRRDWESTQAQIYSSKAQIKRLKEAQKRLRSEIGYFRDVEREVGRLSARLERTSGIERLSIAEDIRSMAPGYGAVLVQRELAAADFPEVPAFVERKARVTKYKPRRIYGMRLPDRVIQVSPPKVDRVGAVLARLGLIGGHDKHEKRGMFSIGEKFGIELEVARAIAAA